VIACSLLPYDPRFEIGQILSEVGAAVPFNSPDCAKFCALSDGAAAASKRADARFRQS
jgi:hypothetical protein